MNELTASTIAMLTGESPVRNEEERRCQWVSDAGEQCCTILNPYNSREYCLCHDHLIQHPIHVVPPAGTKGWLVFYELRRARILEAAGEGDGYAHLQSLLQDLSQQQIANAIQYLRMIGNVIEGRKKRDDHPSGYRIEL